MLPLYPFFFHVWGEEERNLVSRSPIRLKSLFMSEKRRTKGTQAVKQNYLQMKCLVIARFILPALCLVAETLQGFYVKYFPLAKRWQQKIVVQSWQKIFEQAIIHRAAIRYHGKHVAFILAVWNESLKDRFFKLWTTLGRGKKSRYAFLQTLFPRTQALREPWTYIVNIAFIQSISCHPSVSWLEVEFFF